MSVAQLKFVLFSANFYNCSRSDYSDAVEIEDNISRWRFYKIEQIIDRQVQKYTDKNIAQYLPQ